MRKALRYFQGALTLALLQHLVEREIISRSAVLQDIARQETELGKISMTTAESAAGW